MSNNNIIKILSISLCAAAIAFSSGCTQRPSTESDSVTKNSTVSDASEASLAKASEASEISNSTEAVSATEDTSSAATKPEENSGKNIESSDEKGKISDELVCIEASVPEASDASPVNAHTITDTEIEDFGKKNLGDLRTSAAEKNNENPNKADTKMKKYFMDPMKKDPARFRFTVYADLYVGNDPKTTVVSVMEQQLSGSDIYYHINIPSEYGNYQKTLLKLGNDYYTIDDDSKTVIKYSEDVFTSINSFTDLSDEIKNLTESGKAECDGKEMDYELYVDGSTYTVAYFTNNQFYKAEIYQISPERTSDETKTFDTEVFESQDDLILSGYLYAEFDLPVDQKLFQLPSDYTVMTDEEYYRKKYSRIQKNN